MSQFDIGYNTGMKKWFVQSMDDARQLTNMNHIENSNLTLKDVMCDTYAWGASPETPNITHGRIRFYSGPKQEMKATGNLADSFEIKDNRQPFKFLKLHGKADINYNIANMTWNLFIDGNQFTTKNIVGIMTGETQKDKIRFNLEESDIYFNTFITLINPDFTTESKDQCNPIKEKK